MSDIRVRPLTEKGNEQYELRVSQFNKRLGDAKTGVNKHLSFLQGQQFESESEITQTQTELRQCFLIFESISEEYFTFLKNTRTNESCAEHSRHRSILDSLSNEINAALREQTPVEDVKTKSVDLVKTKVKASSKPSKSQKSKSSDSYVSSATSILLRQRAKAEAAKVRLKFAEKEAQLLKQQAALEADIKLLASKRDVDEAEAELRIFNEELEKTESSSKHSTVSEEFVQERTARFVMDQNDILDNKINVPQCSVFQVEHKTAGNKSLDPKASEFVPRNLNQTDICTDFTRFIVKKDLLLSRLTRFDDKSEFFAPWETSFKSIMSNLNVTPLEELDLLVKWLGPESSKFARSIRAANTGNPQNGLSRIWERLHDRYACPEMIEHSLKAKLAAFPNLTAKDYKRLFELSDIVSEIESYKERDQYKNLLAYYDSSSGVIPIVCKLPHNLQEKWTTEATKYKKRFNVSHPPFSFFAEFLRDMAKMRNDPSFAYDSVKGHAPAPIQPKNARKDSHVIANMTGTSDKPENGTKADTCPVHNTNHSLSKCRAFRAKPVIEKNELLRKYGLCFRCCRSKDHRAKNCKAAVRCDVCKNNTHCTAMHVDHKPEEVPHGEEGPVAEPVSTTCTQVCGNQYKTSKSCAKTVLIDVYPERKPELKLRVYAIIDDQSNRSLAKGQFFEHFSLHGPETEYTLSSCSGHATLSGRRASGFVVESLDGGNRFKLPTLIECDYIPDMRSEIPPPEVTAYHSHLNDIEIPAINNEAEILLLLGRDLLPVHHVLDQRIGDPHSPYAQKLPLGWVVIGETCLGGAHTPETVSVYKTNTLQNGRPTLMEPCFSEFEVKDHQFDIGKDIFVRTKYDNQKGLSVDDKEFLSIMDEGFTKNFSGKWTAPLPFRLNRERLPNNRSQALKRARSLDRDLQRNPLKREHVLEFMGKVLSDGHAEVAKDLDENTERWYLPLFAIYHPKKPDRVRCVFDSSARHEGVSLNDVLLTGPDLVNNLLGILLRFRQHGTAITADIERMFYCFAVLPEHRDFLRFLWYKNNDPSQELIEYRMTVHVFGNSPSPAVAAYGLRKAVQEADAEVRDYVTRNFYVDDGLVSSPVESDSIDLLKRTQRLLLENGRIRLHKIASNSVNVLGAFDHDDLAKDIKSVDLDTAPLQRSLGLNWDIGKDAFTFRVSSEPKPFTKRGVLSTLNSLYDPIGFVAPVVVRGKLLLRELITLKTDWDEELPPEYELEWRTWCESLKCLESTIIPRTYTDISLLDAARKEIHVFSDASKDVIAAVAYIKIYDVNGSSQVGFILGKAKVAPSHGHTIPRLELCAAILGVELKETVVEQLDIIPDSISMYTDSKVVLGYIYNENRRFFVYVGNRVDRIRSSTKPTQWSYVPTNLNPADIATRPISAERIQNSPWLLGTDFLSQVDKSENSNIENFDIIDSDRDKEVRPLVTETLLTSTIKHQRLGCDRFERFSEWKSLVDTIARLQHIVKCFKEPTDTCRGWHTCQLWKNAGSRQSAELFVIKEVQHEYFSQEIRCLSEGKPLPRSSSILPLSPYLDQDGVLRVGGRLNRSKKNLTIQDTNPIIIPKQHHIAVLLIRHFHESVCHQGRHFTEGAVRSGGFWIVGGRRLVSSIIHRCVTCRKLRGKVVTQKMADLPEDRLQPSPPFTYVGVDTFGPWLITTRRTRGGQAQGKRWAILFTCLVSRAIHIEIVEDISSSTFINALRRFIALRGPVLEYRSDRGTNFVGAVDDMNLNVVRVEDGAVKDFLYQNGSSWVFNPPHASHMGGAWERMIGISRRILDSMLANVKGITHDVLTTLMAEVCAIVNARPILPVSTDPEAPLVLTPATLLTQKTSSITGPLQPIGIKDTYRSTWKRVQYLADEFWHRWRKEYLQQLQKRQKWTSDVENLKEGDVILLKDAQCNRNQWPVGYVQRVFPSQDGRVRTAEVRVSRGGKSTVYVRPVSELILLTSE